MIELIRCPFCGGKGEVYESYHDGKKVWRVMCGERRDCCLIMNYYNSPDEAAQAWNKRTLTEGLHS